MGLMQFLGEVGNDLLCSMLEKGLDASPEKITEYNNDQLKNCGGESSFIILKSNLFLGPFGKYVKKVNNVCFLLFQKEQEEER